MKCLECELYWKDIDGCGRCHCDGVCPCENKDEDKYFYPDDESFDDWDFGNDGWVAQ